MNRPLKNQEILKKGENGNRRRSRNTLEADGYAATRSLRARRVFRAQWTACPDELGHIETVASARVVSAEPGADVCPVLVGELPGHPEYLARLDHRQSGE